MQTIPLPVYPSADTVNAGNTEPKIPVFWYTGFRCTSLVSNHTFLPTV